MFSLRLKLDGYRGDAVLDRLVRDAERSLASLDSALAGTSDGDRRHLIAVAAERERLFVDRIGQFQRRFNLPAFEDEPASKRRQAADAPDLFFEALQQGLSLGLTRGLERLICHLHGLAAPTVPGAGRIRTSQNWIGPSGEGIEAARFVPPPPALVRQYLEELEAFLRNDASLAPLLRCAVAFAQLLDIHPFVDGNGRVARLTALVLMRHYKILQYPTLYLPRYTTKYMLKYSETLDIYHMEDKVYPWMILFVSIIIEASQDIRQ